MNEIKDYNTNLVTMDAELFKQLKILAAQLNKDQNNLLEEAAQDLIEKYKDQDRLKPSFTGLYLLQTLPKNTKQDMH
jgi:hypothetical protein